MAGDEQMAQDEIEELVRRAQGEAGSQPPAVSARPAGDATLKHDEMSSLLGGKAPAAAAPRTGASGAGADPRIEQGDIEYLLSQAEAALASVTDPHDDVPPGIAPFQLHDFAGSPASTEAATLELVRDVQLDLKIELGRTRMVLEDVLRLRKGAVVPLDKLAGDPVDIYVNGRLIARGEILVLNDNFCVRVAELISGEAA